MLSQLIYNTTEVVEYSETQEIEWTHNEDTTIINGYPCLTATAYVAGRKWCVWYTLEIPTKANLWRFTGLPRLVILTEDESGEFKFECTDIDKVEESILTYEWHEDNNVIIATNNSRQNYLQSIEERIDWDIKRLQNIIKQLENKPVKYTADDIKYLLKW